MKKIQQLLDLTFWKFVLVGIINTVVGTTVMFVAYNALHFSYWVSSASNYIIGSIVSYFLNKYFTFQNKEKSAKQIAMFITNITICYLLAYGLAKPVAAWLFSGFSVTVQENIAMLAGMCIFVGMNYLGQRFVVFREAENE